LAHDGGDLCDGGFLFIAAGSPRQSVALLSAQQR
jgi:hypothetical protein